MNEANNAVFLSYAREDAGAARRVAEALRAFGLQVWLDEAELRGGDAWDQKIRGQIRTCGLFIPIISARTQERPEGYFRREWKLAVDRMQDMAAGVAFIMPVVIDGTREEEALVPDEFMRLQWTRLAHGLPSPEFVEQVRKLLSRASGAAANARRVAVNEPVAGPRTQGAREKKRGFPSMAWIALGVLAGALTVVFVVRRSPASAGVGREGNAGAGSVAAEPVMAKRESPAVDFADAKSVAVLPFANFSPEKENEFFADGVHEDVLTNLAKIGQLKVIARTSVMEYRNTTKKIPQIARELGVAYILEGSVRRSGNRVRVVFQLIDGRTGQHVLAPDPYDRDLADIFAIQSDIAQSIAAKLQAVLAPKEKAVLERAPTDNLAAYDLYLKAREIMDREPDQRLRANRAQALLESALQYDPQFAQAWHGLGLVHLGAYYRFDQTERRRVLAKEAIDKARALAPEDGAILGLETNYFIDVRDLPQARELAERLKQDHPSLAVTYHVLARLDSRGEHPRDALANYRKAHSLDPRSPTVLLALVAQLRGARRYDEAMALLDQSDEIVKADALLEWARVMIPYEASGSTQEFDVLRRRVTPAAERGDKRAISHLAGMALVLGDADELLQLWERHGDGFTLPGGGEQFAVATALIATGQRDRARPILARERDRYRERLVSRPDNIENWFYLAATHALMGDKEGTFAVKREMLAANPGLPEAWLWRFEDHLLLAWLGEREAALDDLAARLAEGRTTMSVHVMRTGLRYRALQGDPRFKAMLADPKHQAPRF